MRQFVIAEHGPASPDGERLSEQGVIWGRELGSRVLALFNSDTALQVAYAPWQPAAQTAGLVSAARIEANGKGPTAQVKVTDLASSVRRERLKQGLEYLLSKRDLGTLVIVSHEVRIALEDLVPSDLVRTSADEAATYYAF